MISNENIIANAVSGKTARPCDCCIKKRARWYCPSDDAFLCQGCDGSVHSANPLARRHERVLLKTASASIKLVDTTNYLPTWHRGLTRKMRTPRHAKQSLPVLSRTVPELGCEDPTTSSSNYNDCESDDRVPIFDPFIPELYPGSDLGDFEEFAADVETLLGKGLDDELCGIEELGFLDNEEEMKLGEMIKSESDDVASHEPFDLSFIYDDHVEGEDEKESKEMGGREKMTSLRLDYDAISQAWASQGSPWISGQRPHINLQHDYSWPHCLMGTIGGEAKQEYYGKWHNNIGQLGAGMGMGDGEREARVSRYREKRRTRLFSKKIRYEVRKLNAEKRPRMKGRFVKRSSSTTSNNSLSLLSK